MSLVRLGHLSPPVPRGMVAMWSQVLAAQSPEHQIRDLVLMPVFVVDQHQKRLGMVAVAVGADPPAGCAGPRTAVAEKVDARLPQALIATAGRGSDSWCATPTW